MAENREPEPTTMTSTIDLAYRLLVEGDSAVVRVIQDTDFWIESILGRADERGYGLGMRSLQWSNIGHIDVDITLANCKIIERELQTVIAYISFFADTDSEEAHEARDYYYEADWYQAELRNINAQIEKMGSVSVSVSDGVQKSVPKQVTIPIDLEEMRTLVGALHDTKCCLEQQVSNPKTSDINYADMTDEVTRILALETKLYTYVGDLHNDNDNT
jgi:hypothetical protein